MVGKCQTKQGYKGIEEETKEMIKLAMLPIVLLAALVPLCSGTVWGHLLLLAIASGILLGTISLGAPRQREAEKALNK